METSALTDLRTFPVPDRREAGYQLDQAQHGGEPDDWKPMGTIGQGVREIRIRDVPGDLHRQICRCCLCAPLFP